MSHKLIGKYIAFIRNHAPSQTWNYFKYRVTSNKMTVLSYDPIHLLINITLNCNHHCSFCPRHTNDITGNNAQMNDLTLERYRQILNKQKSAVSVYLTGGEPFLHGDIFNMIEYAHLMNMHISASTNGALLENKINQISNSALASLNLSLNADNPYDYERMNGAPKRDFSTVLNNIIGLVEKKRKHKRPLKLKISYVCTLKNYTKIPEMIQLAVDLKVDEMLFHNLIPYNLPGFSKEQALYEDNSDVVELIKSVESTKLIISMPRLYKKTILERCCRMPFTTLSIMSSGIVSVCCQIISTRTPTCNVLRDPNVWNHTQFQQIRKNLIDNSKPLPELCKTCPEMLPSQKILPRK